MVFLEGLIVRGRREREGEIRGGKKASATTLSGLSLTALILFNLHFHKKQIGRSAERGRARDRQRVYVAGKGDAQVTPPFFFLGGPLGYFSVVTPSVIFLYFL